MTRPRRSGLANSGSDTDSTGAGEPSATLVVKTKSSKPDILSPGNIGRMQTAPGTCTSRDAVIPTKVTVAAWARLLVTLRGIERAFTTPENASPQSGSD